MRELAPSHEASDLNVPVESWIWIQYSVIESPLSYGADHVIQTFLLVAFDRSTVRTGANMIDGDWEADIEISLDVGPYPCMFLALILNT